MPLRVRECGPSAALNKRGTGKDRSSAFCCSADDLPAFRQPPSGMNTARKHAEKECVVEADDENRVLGLFTAGQKSKEPVLSGFRRRNEAINSRNRPPYLLVAPPEEPPLCSQPRVPVRLA